MEKNEAVFQYLVSPLQKLGLEEKLSYFSQICPPGLGAFPNQSIGQYLFSYVSAVNDKLHLNTDEKPLPEFMKEHGAAREYLLKSVVGEDCFPRYMQQLEELRSKRRKEIMENTSRLYHFSRIRGVPYAAPSSCRKCPFRTDKRSFVLCGGGQRISLYRQAAVQRTQRMGRSQRLYGRKSGFNQRAAAERISG